MKFEGKTVLSARKALKISVQHSGEFRRKFRNLRFKFIFFGNFVQPKGDAGDEHVLV